MSDVQAARLCGVREPDYRRLLAEIEGAGIASRTEDGILFSRRMVRDEHLRAVRARSGSLGGNPNLVNQNPKQTDNHSANQSDKQTPTPSSSSSSSTSESKVKSKTVAPAIDSASPHRSSGRKASRASASPAALPPWIPAEPWAGYEAMRNAKRKPMTPRARELVIAELERLRTAGHDVAAVLDASTRNGWTDVYAPKDGLRAVGTVTSLSAAGSATAEAGKRWLAEQERRDHEEPDRAAG